MLARFVLACRAGLALLLPTAKRLRRGLERPDMARRQEAAGRQGVGGRRAKERTRQGWTGLLKRIKGTRYRGRPGVRWCVG